VVLKGAMDDRPGRLPAGYRLICLKHKCDILQRPAQKAGEGKEEKTGYW